MTEARIFRQPTGAPSEADSDVRYQRLSGVLYTVLRLVTSFYGIGND